MHILKKGFLACLTIMTMSMVFLTSCSDDEDLENVVNTVTAAEAVDFDGTRLTVVDDQHFIYNADGTLREMKHSHGNSECKTTLDYATGTITFSDGDTEDKGHFTTNEKGYFTYISISGSDEDEKWTNTFKFQYNSSDHLIKLTAEEADTDDDGSTNKLGKTIELTWNGDLLSSVRIIGLDDDNDGWDYLYKYSYDDAVDNRYMQYTDNILINFDLYGGFEDFLFVGLCGKGSSKFPSKVEEKEYDKTFNYSITYELNSKGLVEKEDDIEYTYDNISKASAPAKGSKAAVDKKRHENSRNHTSPFRSKK